MQKINFLATDNLELTGFLYTKKSEIKSKDVILSIHGMATNCFKKREDVLIEKVLEKNMDFFAFNNRGSELVKYCKKDGKSTIAGTSYENIFESYHDILGAILELKKLGYENIFIQGHSLGATKTVYVYNKLLEGNNEIINNIKGIILLSLTDIPTATKFYLQEKFDNYLEYAEDKKQSGKGLEIMPQDAFIHPISVNTFLIYAKYYKDIDFAKYTRDNEFEVLNRIMVPIFMRWGNDRELILQKAEDLVSLVDEKIVNSKKDIDYIDGANHNYLGKEEIVAEQIIEFISNIR